MTFGVDEEGKRVHIDDAIVGRKYYCQDCKEELIQRRGLKNVPHFSHVKGSGEKCDCWKYDKGPWHSSMQNLFLPECQEVTIKDSNGIYHRADVFTNNTVIEFQHSPMNERTYNERNEFYKKNCGRIMWLFDCREADIDETFFGYKFKNEIAAINAFEENRNALVFLQLSGKDEADFGDKTVEIRRIIKKEDRYFKLDTAIGLEDFIAVANGEIEYEKLILRKEWEDKHSGGSSIREIMEQTKDKSIIVENIANGNKAIIDNNEKILKYKKIKGRIKDREHLYFSYRKLPIFNQNERVWRRCFE